MACLPRYHPPLCLSSTVTLDYMDLSILSLMISIKMQFMEKIEILVCLILEIREDSER